MHQLLKPHMFVNSVSEIALDALEKKGIRALIIDLDNTITEWQDDRLSPEVLAWFSRLKTRGFCVCLVSNNKEKRVARVAQVLDIPYIFKATKPRRRAFRQAMVILGTSPDETAVIGDQIFTDVLGGNRLGLLTILVAPISRREFIGTRLMRVIEGLIIRHFLKNHPCQQGTTSNENKFR
ncbi:MAG: YqeG family HAD IIIA-type phosphatase [Firmicutes bacterium]|nr:YqeG family HAD IIIA-type phosphatase [Bacillota bacterium]